MAAERGDGELVEAFRRGERAAFEALVSRYVRLAGAVAYGIVGDYESAADVVQEAFLKAHGALADLREPEKFKSWLHGVVRSAALDWVRKHRRRGAGAQAAAIADLEAREDALPAAAGAGPLEGAERRETEEVLRRAIEALPESYREILVLKYMDERSYKEISELLGITIETIESRLFRARRALREKLAGLGLGAAEAEAER